MADSFTLTSAAVLPNVGSYPLNSKGNAQLKAASEEKQDPGSCLSLHSRETVGPCDPQRGIYPTSFSVMEELDHCAGWFLLTGHKPRPIWGKEIFIEKVSPSE